jgi:hypothetical protein
MKQWDVFISHAFEDKESVARPLKEYLEQKGITVWLDTSEMRIGDSIRKRIEDGLIRSRYVVAVLSRNFFNKK